MEAHDDQNGIVAGVCGADSSMEVGGAVALLAPGCLLILRPFISAAL